MHISVWLLQEASWIHCKYLLLGQTHFAKTPTAKRCSRTLFDASLCAMLSQLTMVLTMAHCCTLFFYLVLQLWSFNVGCKCEINLSACGRYVIDCAIPFIQNTQIHRSEVGRCTLSISCSIDPDYCPVFVDEVGVFFLNKCLELKKLLNSSRQTSLSFLFILLAFWLW